jgi:hypothetical protein
MGSGHRSGGSVGGVGTGGEYRDGNGGSAYVDLVEDATVGDVRRSGIGPLIFWALLSLSAVVVNSWGQQAPGSNATSGAPAAMMIPSKVAPQFPAQAYGQGVPARPVAPAVVAVPMASPVTPTMPRGFVPATPPRGVTAPPPPIAVAPAAVVSPPVPGVGPNVMRSAPPIAQPFVPGPH